MKRILIGLLCSGLVAGAMAMPQDVYESNLYTYAETSHALDKAWQDVGQKIDVAMWDLERSANVPENLPEQGVTLYKQLQKRYLAAEDVRAALRRELHLKLPKSNYLLAVENLEDVPATYYYWAGFRSFKLRWADGTEIEIPLNTFSNAVYNADYNNGGDSGPGIFIYGRQSASYIAVSDFMPEGGWPDGDCTLIVTGMDCDKGGISTRIKISIYGQEVFSGVNQFPKDHSAAMTVKVPAKALTVPVTPFYGDLGQRLLAYEKQVADFAADCKKAEVFLKAAEKYRANAKYQQISAAEVFSPTTFLRAIDYTDTLWRPDYFRYPGFNYNYEYLAKLPSALHANLVSFCLGRSGGDAEKYPIIKAYDGMTAVPYMLWADGKLFDHGDMVASSYFGNLPKLQADLAKFKAMYPDLQKSIGVQVDEPTIEDTRLGNLLENQALMQAWGRPEPPVNMPSADDAEAMKNYMDYQYFKADFMAQHYKALYEQEKANGGFASLVIMDMHGRELMGGSYVAMGKALDWIGTDLYDNGSIRESVSLQLLKNASKGKVIMWPGTGYSCRSPRTFRRSLVNGTAWGDGLQLWTLMYFDRYRDANIYWSRGGEALSKDDRGGDLLGNYKMQYADIVQDVFKWIEDNENLLVQRESLNPVALLLSERTQFAKVKPRAENARLYQDYLGLYSQLAGTGRFIDARYVETLEDSGRDYKVLILADAELLSAAEAEYLNNFVYNGGTLIVGGKSGSKNMHNLPEETWLLAPASGVLNADTFAAGAVKENIAGVEVIKNRYGQGVCYTILIERLGNVVDAIPECGLSGTIKPELAACLEAILSPAEAKFSVKVSAPRGVVAALQENMKGEAQIFLIDYRNKSEQAEVVITLDNMDYTVKFSEYTVIVLKDLKNGNY